MGGGLREQRVQGGRSTSQLSSIVSSLESHDHCDICVLKNRIQDSVVRHDDRRCDLTGILSS